MLNLIKKNGATILFAGALAAIFGLQAFGINMKSNLVVGLLMVIPGILIFTKHMNPKLKFDKEELMLFIFLAFFIVSTFLSSSPYGYKEYMTFVGGALLYLFVSNLRTSKLPVRQFHWLTVLIITVFSLFGIYEITTGPASRLDGLFYGAEVYSNYPNAMAQLLLFGIPITWLLYRYYQKNKTVRTVISLALVINLMALWLTFSRAGYIAFAIMLGASAALYLVREKKPVEMFRITATILTFIIIGWIGAVGINSLNEQPIDIEERVTSEDVSSEKSLTERYGFWSGSLKMASDRPVFGVGPGSFEYFYPEYQKGLLAISDHPHNLLLKILTENGYLATLSFFIFLALVAIKSMWEYIWIKNKESESYGILMIVFLGLTLHNLVDYNLNFTLLWLIYFSVIGLLENAYTWHESRIAVDQHRFVINKKIYSAKIAAISLTLVGISFFQGYGYTYLKSAEAGSLDAIFEIKTAQQYLPFKHQVYEVAATIESQTQTPEFDYPEKLDGFHPLVFHDQSFKFLDQEYDLAVLENLAMVHGKNNFNYHLIYLNALSNNDESEKLNELNSYYQDFIKEYIELMKQNAHQTVATLNPYYADQIFNFFLLLDTSIDDNEEWKLLYQEYEEAWQDEINKFNARFNTNFNRVNPDAAINSNF